MSDTEEKPVSRLENRNTLNLAINCLVLNLEDKPKILLVDYQEFDDCETEKRLPGGKFQARDLIISIETYLSKILEESGQRIPALEQFCYKVFVENQKFESFYGKIEKHSEQNGLSNKFTGELWKGLQDSTVGLHESVFEDLVLETQLNAVRRELKEESQAGEIGEIHFTSSSRFGPHFKLGFVSTQVKAPCLYTGSGDRKIKKSDWYDLDENIEALLAERHWVNFQEGINKAIELKIHPNVDVLNKFLVASK